MLLDICFGNKSVWRILTLFGESPGAGFTRQDLRNYTKLGNKALSFALKRLVAFGILTKSKGNLSLAVYKLNKENKYIEEILSMLQKERQDLNQLPYNFSIIIRELSREIIDSVEVLEIYLFGSVAKGTYRTDSDIDISVILKEKNPRTDMIIKNKVDKFSGRFKRKIQCFVLTKTEIENKKSDLIKEILKHGIKII